MALDDLLSTFDRVTFEPRTLQINLPDDLTESLSVSARAFLEIATGKKFFTILDLTNGKWKNDSVALNFFLRCHEEVRVEILAFLTLYIHEYTHRIDFLISPFGLHFYANTLREYWLLQQFVPRILDDPRTVNRVKFLVAFGDFLTVPELCSEQRGQFCGTIDLQEAGQQRGEQLQ